MLISFAVGVFTLPLWGSTIKGPPLYSGLLKAFRILSGMFWYILRATLSSENAIGHKNSSVFKDDINLTTSLFEHQRISRVWSIEVLSSTCFMVEPNFTGKHRNEIDYLYFNYYFFHGWVPPWRPPMLASGDNVKVPVDLSWSSDEIELVERLLRWWRGNRRNLNC